ncbi:hypothetical protein [Polycladidibacter hongkongensis]|uniref:hypothetical protein n=1 Tax=Polycladidibacter hongkongensis TaxID=1647556 RepID=UPI00082C97D4|nr:hypothetical protein [Pseudovibrio hongkongensis]
MERDATYIREELEAVIVAVEGGEAGRGDEGTQQQEASRLRLTYLKELQRAREALLRAEMVFCLEGERGGDAPTSQGAELVIEEEQFDMVEISQDSQRGTRGDGGRDESARMEAIAMMMETKEFLEMEEEDPCACGEVCHCRREAATERVGRMSDDEVRSYVANLRGGNA